MKFLSQHCDAMLLTMVFFLVREWVGGWRTEVWADGGFAKVDNRFGLILFVQEGPLS